MNRIIASIKRVVTTFNIDLLYPRLKNNKPELLVAQRKIKADPAGNPMVKVYRDDISRGPLF